MWKLALSFWLLAFSRCLAMMIGYGAMPANMIRIFLFGLVFSISSEIIFRSLESLGEK